MKSLFLLFVPLLFFSASGKELRVVSLSPGVTDAICAIGGKRYLCGRSSACNAPGTNGIAIAGDMGLPALEKVLLLRPTHLISDTKHPGGKWKLLERAGIKLIFLPGKNIDDYPGNLRILGKLLNLEKNAGRAAAEYEHEISELRKSIPARKCKVLPVFGTAPVISCGKESFIHEALFLAGGENICGIAGKSYFTVSTEYILMNPPEVIIFGGIPEVMIKSYFSRREFRNLPAVKKRRIIEVDADDFCRAGIRLPEAVKALRTQLLQH